MILLLPQRTLSFGYGGGGGVALAVAHASVHDPVKNISITITIHSQSSSIPSVPLGRWAVLTAREILSKVS